MTDTDIAVPGASHDGPESAPDLDKTAYDALVRAIGDRIRTARIKQGWDQQDLAEAIGSSPTVLSRLEHGARLPRGISILKIFCALALRPSTLLAEAEDDAFPLGKPWDVTPDNRTTVPDATAPETL